MYTSTEDAQGDIC